MSTPTTSCRQKAFDLVARRPHLSLELRRKLEARGYATEDVDGALERLRELGLLDDEQTARDWAGGSLWRKGYGPLRIRVELERKGLDPGSAAVIVAELFPEGDHGRAVEVAERWLATRSPDVARLARYLERRGFSGAAISRVLQGLRE